MNELEVQAQIASLAQIVAAHDRAIADILAIRARIAALEARVRTAEAEVERWHHEHDRMLLEAAGNVGWFA